MEAEVRWVEDLRFIGQSKSGHAVVMDGSDNKLASSPMEMVLMAAGGCSSIDVIAGLKMADQKVDNCVAKLTAKNRETSPKVFTHINIHFDVIGKNLDEKVVAQVVSDSLEKYCTVCLMLGEVAEMTHSWRIQE